MPDPIKDDADFERHLTLMADAAGGFGDRYQPLLAYHRERVAELAAVKADAFRAQQACEQMGTRMAAMMLALNAVKPVLQGIGDAAVVMFETMEAEAWNAKPEPGKPQRHVGDSPAMKGMLAALKRVMTYRHQHLGYDDPKLDPEEAVAS